MLSAERVEEIKGMIPAMRCTETVFDGRRADAIEALLADRAEREAEVERLREENERLKHFAGLSERAGQLEGKALDLAEAENARLRAAVAGLEKACREAREDVEEWAEDLGDERQRVTLKQLWGLSRRLDAALAAAGAGTTEDPAS
jgi:chromosome segregation ATPase